MAAAAPLEDEAEAGGFDVVDELGGTPSEFPADGDGDAEAPHAASWNTTVSSTAIPVTLRPSLSECPTSGLRSASLSGDAMVPGLSLLVETGSQ